MEHVTGSHVKNTVSFQLEFYSANVGEFVRLSHGIPILGNLTSAMVPKLPLTSRPFYVLWHMSGNIGYSWENWRRTISSTKLTTTDHLV